MIIEDTPVRAGKWERNLWWKTSLPCSRLRSQFWVKWPRKGLACPALKKVGISSAFEWETIHKSGHEILFWVFWVITTVMKVPLPRIPSNTSNNFIENIPFICQIDSLLTALSFLYAHPLQSQLQLTGAWIQDRQGPLQDNDFTLRKPTPTRKGCREERSDHSCSKVWSRYQLAESLSKIQKF